VHLGVYDVAIRYFSKAIEADPGYYEAYYNRGYSFELLGDVMNARNDYKTSLRIRPDYQLSIEALNRLDRLDRQMNQQR
jgi:tetratricopeptide (TPR) repeat protein